MPSLYASPTGSGDQSGSSIANAAALSNLNTLISHAGPGGEVLLLADRGTYTLSADLQINQGGATIRGVDSAGQSMQATIAAPTASIFVLRNGADNLTFKDLVLKDTTGGYGALRVGGDIRNLHVDNVDATNVRTFLAVGASTGQTASVDGLVVKNVEVTGYTSGAIKLAGNSHDILLEDITLDGQNKDPSSFMVGVQMYDTAHDIVIRRVTASNNLYTGTTYWNGDGFVAESGVYNLKLEDTIARFNGDAGYDIKASAVTLENAIAEGNKKNFRFWGDGITANDITGLNPHLQGGNSSQNQIWLSENSHVTVNGGTFTDNDASTIVFEVEGGSTLTLVGVNVAKAGAALLQNLGAGALLRELSPSAPVTTAPVTGSSLIGAASADNFLGTGGADDLRGEGGDDYIRGGDGDDRILGGDGFDDIHGNMGADTVDGGRGPDWVVGGQGDDILFGQEDDDIVLGNIGMDTCVGGEGDDVVRGGREDDSLAGGAGNDFLSGDRGADTISGGAGADTFNVFAESGLDRVLDFSQAEGDHVRIEGASYSVYATGSDTVVDLGAGAQLVLVGVPLTSLSDGWLITV